METGALDNKVLNENEIASKLRDIQLHRLITRVHKQLGLSYDEKIIQEWIHNSLRY